MSQMRLFRNLAFIAAVGVWLVGAGHTLKAQDDGGLVSCNYQNPPGGNGCNNFIQPTNHDNRMCLTADTGWCPFQNPCDSTCISCFPNLRGSCSTYGSPAREVCECYCAEGDCEIIEG